ncbi:MAG TPA: phage holin family protein [Thermoanaerobaculia bacterium]|nr:phage holin family protein [Thermoanaerobaculia bacterium]
MQPWIDLFRSLGEALLEVWRAELATLQDDLSRSGRHLGVALGLFGAAAVLLFWTVGLVLFALIALLHVWLPWWGAALTVLALFLIAMAILAGLGLKRLRKVENPVETLRRRVDSHLDWWQHGLLARPQTLDVEPATLNDEEPLGRELP